MRFARLKQILDDIDMCSHLTDKWAKRKCWSWTLHDRWFQDQHFV